MKITYEGTSKEIEEYISISCPRDVNGKPMECSVYLPCKECWGQCDWIELIKTDENRE